MSPILKWPGGKYYLKNFIVPMIDLRYPYLELFAGGLSILLNKEKSPVEIANDIDPDVINFYNHLNDDFIDELYCYTYDIESFNEAKDYDQLDFNQQRAIYFFIRNKMSQHGLGKYFSTSLRFKTNKNISRRVSEWISTLENLKLVKDRLKGVKFFNQDALSLIEDFYGYIYCDPPYVQSTRTKSNIYTYEMDDNHQRLFLESVIKSKAKIIISGYDNRLYNSYLKDWKRYEYETTNWRDHSKKRLEIIWAN